MKKKRILTLIFATIIALTSATLLSFAYFKGDLTDSDGNTMYFYDGASSIQIHSVADLVHYGTDTIYNSVSDVAEEDTRKTLVLLDDLTLWSDVILTADCHIDLNGHQIDMNGFTITIKHNYNGTFMFCNGSVTAPFETDDGGFIINSSSHLVVSTPNAMVIIDDVTPLSGFANAVGSVSYDEDYSWYEIVDCNDELVANNALRMIKTLLCDNYDDNKAYYDVVDDSDFDYQSASVYGDIDLPYHYYNYDELTFEYSSNSAYLDEFGNVTPPTVGTVGNTTLTVTVNYRTATVTKDFDIAIINQLDYYNWAVRGVEIFEDYLIPYSIYDDGGNFLYYYLGTPVQISAKNSYFGGTYTFATLDENEDVIFDTSESNSHFLPIDNNGTGYIMTINEDVRYLRVTCTVNGTSYTRNIDVQGEGNAYIINNYIYAITIAKELYGDKIVIEPSDDLLESLYGYTKQELYTDVTPYIEQNVVAFNYELLNNMDYTYEIGDINDVQTLYVSPTRTVDPNIIQSTFLNMIFTFSTSPYTVEIKIPIVYEGTDLDDKDRFKPYYNYFNTQFVNTSNSYTYNSFSVPFSYGSTYPIYYFDVVDADNNVINNANGQLLVDGNVIMYMTLSYKNVRTSENITYTYSQFMTLNSDTLLNIITTGNAKWNIIINTNNLTKVDQDIFFRYRYKMAAEDTIWYGSGAMYGDTNEIEPIYLSELVIPGIIRNESGGIPDSKLYERIFEVYHEGETYVAGSTYIIFSRLSQIVESLDFTNNATASASTRINSFEGINYLTGVKELHMQNALYNVISQTSKTDKRNQTLTTIRYISGMLSLEYLDLADNGLTDSNADNRNMPTGTNNYFIRELSPLDNLKELHLENRDGSNTNDNAIYEFYGLDLLGAIEDVYVYGNTFTCTYYTNWISFLNNTYTNILNGMYGSTGGVNQAVFTESVQKGVNIYYNKNGSDLILFDPNTSSAFYTNLINLRGIEYQEKLATGISIERIYENFSTNPGSYGIVDPENISGSVTLYFNTHTISYEPVLEDGETIYTTTQFSIVYTITYRYSSGLTSGTVDIPINFTFTIERY